MKTYTNSHLRLRFSMPEMRIAVWIMLFMFLSNQSPAQERTITGRVTSAEDNAPLAGVNILCKGTAVGTISDAQGNYSLLIPHNVNFLLFSSIGFKTKEVEIAEQSEVNMALIADVTQLSEVVVTGTGIALEKRKLAFAVESVKGSDLPVAPTASIDQALIGKIPGALIMSGNGAPGANISILLRGVNSINRGTQPMILLNGIQVASTNLNALDLNTIDRVEVVQGAAAASIYGAQGANGVIQIFTKKGSKGKLQVNFSSSVANNEYINSGQLSLAKLHGFKTNADNYVIGANGDTLVQNPNTLLYNENVVWAPQDTSVVVNKPYNRNLKYYDHIKEFYGSAFTYSNSLSLAGGNELNDFNISVSNTRQENIFKGDGYNDRTNLISNLGIKISPKLTFRSITQLIYTHNTVNLFNKQDFNVNALIFTTLNTRPFADLWIKDSAGNYGIKYGSATGPNMFNPNYSFQYTDTDDVRSDIIQSFQLMYNPYRWLEFELNYGINHSDRTVEFTGLNQSTNANSIATGVWDGWFATSNTGEISTFEETRTSQHFLATANVSLDFQRDFGKNWPIKSITQFAYDYRSSNTHDYDTYGLGLPLQPPITANQATTFKVQTDFTTEFITYGVLVNQRFEWKEIAGISAGFRSDYSSAFGEGSDPFTFPRADGFVRISGFDFYDNSALSKVFLEWKLRGAYGQAGIQPAPFDRFPTLTARTIGTTNAYYLGPAQSNPKLNVEVSTEWEAGTDISIADSKGRWLRNTQISFTWWKRATDNGILRVDAPPSSGVGTLIDNAIGLESTGLQASLGTRLYSSKSFTWNFTLNYGKQSTMVTSVSGGEIVIGAAVLVPGEPVGQLNGNLMIHDVNAINPNTGEPFIPVDEQDNYVVASNGWVVDKNRRVPYMTPDKFPLGNPFPDFNASFINDFTIKQFFTVGFQIDWIKGGHTYNNTKNWLYRDGIHSDFTKSITIDGKTGAWASFYNGVYNAVSPSGIKNYFNEDGSFARLRNAYVGIDLAGLLKMKIRNLQVLLSGRNLITWTNYTGIDPELSTYNTSGVLFQRIDDFVLPNQRTYQVTLTIGF